VTLLARALERRAAKAGLAIVGALVVLAVLGPAIAPHDAFTSDFVNGASAVHTPVGPSRSFWLGADRIYRDEFARLALGARFSIAVGVAATLIATAIGGAVGVLAGWFEGRTVDAVLMRTVDVGMAFPFLLLVMALGAAFEHTSGMTVVLVLGATGWLGTARIVRAKTLVVRSTSFVQAAIALGCSTPRVLLRHVLPNVGDVLLVAGIVQIAQMILAESVLGYLGVGLSPPAPTLGRMLMEGQDYYLAGPWLVAAPGITIVLAVLGFHLLGEGLRGGLDARR
jgi:ABC-type dipeptide/oligopeptide/nickel transport system permease subunit